MNPTGAEENEMATLEDIKTRAKRLMELRQKAGWIELWDDIDDMNNLNWSKPDALELVDYVHEVRNTDPRDSTESAARIYSGEKPRITIDPWAQNKATKKQVNGLENYVRWQREKLVLRHEEDLDEEIMRSSVNYDFLIGQLEYLPWQLEVLEQRKKGEEDESGVRSKHELEGALRLGDFMLTLINPHNAFPRFSKHGLEECLLRTVTDLQSFEDDWGDKAKAVIESAAGAEDKLKHVTVWDYYNHDVRVVWAYVQEDPALPEDNPRIAGALKVINDKHKLPFLPIVAVRGGKNLNPMLKSIVDSGQWDTVCSLETAVMTEALAMSWAPRFVIKGPDGANVRIVYGSPGRPLLIDDFHTVEELKPPQLDVGLMALADRERLKMEKSTLSSVLQGFSPEAGVAFASINTATQSALKVLAPHRRLAERFWVLVFMQMLGWKHFADDDIDTGKATMKAKDIPINRLYFNVTMKADVQLDQQAMMNMANQARQVGYSKATSMEKSGESDPDSKLEEARKEAFEDVMTAGELQKDQARLAFEAQLENQGLGLLAQMANDPQMIQVLQQLQQQIIQGQAGGAANGGGPQGQASPRQPSPSGVEGQGFAGNAGGQNTAQAAPEATRELQNREDRGGTEF